jgi:hypothetical protein
MQNIDIPATARTPRLQFDYQEGNFLIEGESYPEDTKKFYDGHLAGVYSFLGTKIDRPCCISFKLKYFNSSSAKILMDLIIAVEESAKTGNELKVEWHCADDDDNMQELGEEFSEELVEAKFELVTF